jgi:hypothetical protein
MAAKKDDKKPGEQSRHALGGVAQKPAAQLPSGYGSFLEDLKERIHAARIKAALSANRELIALYWHIGKSIVERQESEGWGASVIDRLSRDIQSAFPGIEGFSASNISRMRSFYLAWNGSVAISAQPVPKLGRENSAQSVPETDAANLPPTLAGIP